LWRGASRMQRVVVMMILLLSAVWVLGPFLWAILNSIKSLEETFQTGAIVPFWQFEPTLDSWRQALTDTGILHALLSSIVVSGGATILVLLIGIPAA
jgi:multiple sugar transport system permease protein